MNHAAITTDTPVLRFDALNWAASDFMPRDQEQSHRLHEPTHINYNIDLTGYLLQNFVFSFHKYLINVIGKKHKGN